MKNLIIIFSIICIGFILNPIGANAQDERTLNSGMDSVTVVVEGLGCPFCAYGLEKKFKELKGIDDVTIDMETGLLNFIFPAADSLSMERIEKQVEEAGYTAVDTKIVRADGSLEATAVLEHAEIDKNAIVQKEVMVSGNCGMCQTRIENTAKKLEGISEAVWDKETKILSVNFDQHLISIEEIEEAISKAGHDTPNFKTSTEVYDNLPGCCQYDREN